MIKLGQTYYDERNGRYLTPNGVGCDPKCYSCIEEEINEDGELEITKNGLVLMMESELDKMIKI